MISMGMGLIPQFRVFFLWVTWIDNRWRDCRPSRHFGCGHLILDLCLSRSRSDTIQFKIIQLVNTVKTRLEVSKLVLSHSWSLESLIIPPFPQMYIKSKTNHCERNRITLEAQSHCRHIIKSMKNNSNSSIRLKNMRIICWQKKVTCYSHIERL